MMTVPAGWYQDGTTPDVVRWWDGSTWTSHTRPVEPGGGSQAASARARQPEPDSKVPVFGARKHARNLEAALQELGGLEYAEIQARTQQAAENLSSIEAKIGAARRTLAQVNSEVARAQAAVIDVREQATLQEVGLYDFAHPAEDSVALAAQLSDVRARIKQMVGAGQATVATTNFTFNNSVSKGAKFVADLSKMMLSAYNAEAENAVKTVRAGSLQTARKRLLAVADRVARYGKMIDLSITPGYQQLRSMELELTARHLAAVDAEKMAERERRAQLREQAKAEAELRAERLRLEKERSHYVSVLEVLRERGDTEEIARLELQLDDVDRALADVDYRTANARAGYVYVISNVGAMGGRMVKIGMTRRLDPMDRVKELSDASVPFPFDVHALFFADDAVAIETMLHNTFAARRVNRINMRREFFYATPAEVLEVLQSHNVAVVEYTLEPKAEQYRLSRAAAQAEAH